MAASKNCVSSLCIVIVTCERYRLLASFTAAQVAANWLHAPPRDYCGLGDTAPDHIPCSAPDTDWLSILYEAVVWLRAKGYEKAYVILDDHMPFDICHAHYLNDTIPGWMDTLGASYIGLLGWDQRRVQKGELLLGKEWYGLQRQDDHFLWRYSLHPALWSVAILAELLTGARARGITTIWAFERWCGSEEARERVPASSTYRVNGLKMLGANAVLRRFRRTVFYHTLDALRYLVAWRGIKQVAEIDHHLRCETHYFDGPYPLFWSGVMQQGRPHDAAMQYLKHRGKSGLASAISAIIQASVPANH